MLCFALDLPAFGSVMGNRIASLPTPFPHTATAVPAQPPAAGAHGQAGTHCAHFHPQLCFGLVCFSPSRSAWPKEDGCSLLASKKETFPWKKKNPLNMKNKAPVRRSYRLGFCQLLTVTDCKVSHIDIHKVRQLLCYTWWHWVREYFSLLCLPDMQSMHWTVSYTASSLPTPSPNSLNSSFTVSLCLLRDRWLFHLTHPSHS